MVQDLGVFKIWAVCTSVKSCKNKARLDPPMLVVVHYATIFHWLWTHGPIVYMPRIRIIKECKWLNGCGMAHNSEIFRVCVYIYTYVILYVYNIREFDIIYIHMYMYTWNSSPWSTAKFQKHGHERPSTTGGTVRHQDFSETTGLILLGPQGQGQPGAQDTGEDGMKDPESAYVHEYIMLYNYIYIIWLCAVASYSWQKGGCHFR